MNIPPFHLAMLIAPISFGVGWVLFKIFISYIMWKHRRPYIKFETGKWELPKDWSQTYKLTTIDLHQVITANDNQLVHKEVYKQGELIGYLDMAKYLVPINHVIFMRQHND